MRLARTILAALAAVFMLAAVAISPASAGEVTGNGKVLPVNAKSECAYSGLEDWADPSEQPEGEVLVKPGVTQNWGQIPKADRDFLTSIGVRPSTLCNGHLNPIK